MGKSLILLAVLSCVISQIASAQKSNFRILDNEGSENDKLSDEIRNYYGYEPAIYPEGEDTADRVYDNEEGQVDTNSEYVWYGYEPAIYPEDNSNANSEYVWYGYEPAIYPEDSSNAEADGNQ